MASEQALKQGEHVDLDAGIRMSRSNQIGSSYELLLFDDTTSSFELSRGDIRSIAELAGFTVKYEGEP